MTFYGGIEQQAAAGKLIDLAVKFLGGAGGLLFMRLIYKGVIGTGSPKPK